METYDFYRFHRDGVIPLFVNSENEGKHLEKRFHNHSFSELVFITQGEAEHIAADNRYSIKKGDVLSLHPGTVHAYDRCRTMKVVNILYDSKSLAMPTLDMAHISSFSRIFPVKQSEDIALQHAPVVTLDDEQLEEMLEETARLKSVLDQMRPGWYFLSLSIFMHIIGRIAVLTETPATVHHAMVQIEKVIAYMTENFDSNISLEQLLKKANMSRRNFYRHFNSCTGTSPFEYLTQLRIRRAIELLRDTDITVAETANVCGLTDANYMCRIFRTRCGISPGQLRKKLRTAPESFQSIFHITSTIKKDK